MTDPIGLEVFRNRMAAIATEMGDVLRRTAHSPNIKERADCSVALFDPAGEMVAQAEHIPVHLGAMPASVAAIIERFQPEPGVQYAVNDPYAGGTHLNDLTLVQPVFSEKRLVGWVANRSHHADVGGDSPGSMPATATRLEQEGCIVSPIEAVRQGEWVDQFRAPFLEATRTPEERSGDLAAQMGSNEVGAARLLELAQTDLDGYRARVAELLDYGQRRMEAALDALPDGIYRFTDVMEFGEVDLPISVAVTIEGGHLRADFCRHRRPDRRQSQRGRSGHTLMSLLRRPGGDRPFDPGQWWVLPPARTACTTRLAGQRSNRRGRWRRATSKPANGSPMCSWGRSPRPPRTGYRRLARGR